MKKELPTIKDIAKRLRISVSTVSRALSNHPRISEMTRERVQKLAGELNYEPNVNALSLKQQKSFIIGVVVPDIREEFFSHIISGIEAAAMENNYRILFGQSYDDLEREKQVLDSMRKQRVDGLLISLSKQTRKYDHLQNLNQYDIPVVYFDRVPQLDKVNKVYCNLFKGTIEMMFWLISRGYKRVALINGTDEMCASKERLNGYIEGMSRKKMKVDMQLVEKTDLSKERTHLAMKSLLALKKPPQAIISFNDYVHMDAVQYAQSQNIQVNKDIVFLSYANLPAIRYTAYPPLASIEQYPYGQGEKAMEIIIRTLTKKEDNGKPEDYYVEELPGTLVMFQNEKEFV